MSNRLATGTCGYGFALTRVGTAVNAYLVARLAEHHWGLFTVSWSEFMIMRASEEMPLLESLRCIAVAETKRDVLAQLPR